MQSVFLFDLDATLTKVETLPLIAKHFHKTKQIEKLTKQTLRGELDFTQSLKQRVAILGDISPQDIADFLANIALWEEFVSFIAKHKKNSFIVTGNLDIWVEKLVEPLGVEVFSSKAVFCDGKTVLQSVLQKQEVVKQFQKEGKYVVMVGDSLNDKEAFLAADYAVLSALVHPPLQGLVDVVDEVLQTTSDSFLHKFLSDNLIFIDNNINI